MRTDERDRLVVGGTNCLVFRGLYGWAQAGGRLVSPRRRRRGENGAS